VTNQNNAIITIKDEVHCVVGGLHPSVTKILHDKYTLNVPNAYFSPKFQVGQWDGTIKFFQKTGRTFINLLDEIVPILTQYGYSIKIDDQRQSRFYTPTEPINEHSYSDIIDPDSGSPIVLRYYQVEALNTVLKEGNGIILSATGSGKTYTNAVLVDQYGKAGLRTITIVPSQDLILQTVKAFKIFGLDVGEYWSKEKNISAQHVVSTWQSLKNNPHLMQQFHVVVVDEVHGAKARLIKELLIDHGVHIAHRFGLTGTMPKAKSDYVSIICAIGPERYEIKSDQLIEEGYLSTLHINITQLREKIPDDYFPDYAAERAYLRNTDDRLLWVANFLYGRTNTLCLVNSVQFGKRLQKIMPDAIFLHGEDDRDKRKSVYDLFEEQEDLTVIATIGIAKQGINIRRIFNLVYVDMGKSFITTLQSIGRGLRKGGDKFHVEVWDVCSDLKYCQRHLRNRISYYKEANFPYQKNMVDYK